MNRDCCNWWDPDYVCAIFGIVMFLLFLFGIFLPAFKAMENWN